jgi:hypothetical protein
MKFVLCRLSGTLNQNLIDSLLETLKERSLTPHTFLLDFSQIKEEGPPPDASLSQFFAQIHPNLKIGISGLKESWKTLVLEGSHAHIPLFSTLEKGKEYFETLARGSESGSTYVRVVDYFRKGEHFYVYCPHCSVKLRIRAIGNHACPSCQSRFYFKPDLSQEGNESTTKYEMLSLE